MAYSEYLFEPADLPPVIRYEKLFENLPLLQEQIPRTGRRPISRNSLLKALLYKALRRLATLSELNFELNNNPSLSQALGFNPLKFAPSIERFSAFLHDIQNEELQTLRQQLVQSLLDCGVITGKVMALDSCPIVALLKDNNLKTAIADRFDKSRKPKGDPDARLGIIVHYVKPFQKKIHFFWGYRNHVISDVDTELPIWEATKPANVAEVRLAKSLLQQTYQYFTLKIDSVVADANYDAEELLTFIIKELKAEAIIPKQPRNEKQSVTYQINNGKIICDAGLIMYRRGKMRPKRTGILYQQYSCPVTYGPLSTRKFITCPVFHAKFFDGKGCNVLIRLEPSIRAEINYDSKHFKEIYNRRTAAERLFARLLAIAMQNPTVRGFNAIQNHVTIAHITVLLVALTAFKAGYPDKCRFIKSFVPNFLNKK
jgi:hypothetical protein